eukprot:TRINITY_DN176_c1_g2_i1.p1 TRINITY_DN176_c1_g2~~TRINITY_DN176_c1_g2_i1.p1  ORF type:complete len:149 (-),score=46.40 TRINITY_DN176_c1_g2_i1:91-537(-)
MVWLPDWLWEKQQREKAKGGGKGKGKSSYSSYSPPSYSSKGSKGWGKSSFSKGKSKGKGKGKGKGKLGAIENRVWVGGLPEGVAWQVLQEHMNQAGKTTWIEVFKGKGAGTAGVSYASPEEAANAIAILNGSIVDGATLEVDVWEKAA